LLEVYDVDVLLRIYYPPSFRLLISESLAGTKFFCGLYTEFDRRKPTKPWGPMPFNGAPRRLTRGAVGCRA
jgi:hypothetical protein